MNVPMSERYLGPRQTPEGALPQPVFVVKSPVIQLKQNFSKEHTHWWWDLQYVVYWQQTFAYSRLLNTSTGANSNTVVLNPFEMV